MDAATHRPWRRRCSCCALPREIGLHPETGTPIIAGLGRYGPFILHDGTYANLPSVEEVFSVGINRAVALLAEKKAGGGKGRFQRAAATVLKELGEHPELGGKVQVLSGRYGPYVKHGDVNATLPRAKEPAALTMDEAVLLIAERAAKGPSKSKRRERQAEGRKASQACKGREGRQGREDGQVRCSRGQAQGQIDQAEAESQGQRGGRIRIPRAVARRPKATSRSAGELPTKDDILTFLQTAGTKAGKREIARHFAIKGNNRIALKALLTEMADEGLLSRQPQGLQGARQAAAVARARDRRPRQGRRAGRRACRVGQRARASVPKCSSSPRRSPAARPTLGQGDRILARITRLSDKDVYGYRYEAEPIKRLPREKRRPLGIFRARKGGGGVIDPVDRKELKEWPIAAGDEGDAKDGDLVRYDLNRSGRFGVPQARVAESLGNPQDQRKVSLIAVHAHGIPDDFPEGVLTEAAEADRPIARRAASTCAI